MVKTEQLKILLASKGLKYVGTRGNTAGAVCIVGEAPGADEDQQGIPFVGASGRELDRLLGESGLPVSSCWWTNPYKVRPPDNKIDRLPEHGIANEVFIEQFLEELNEYKPRIIITCGATGLGILCPGTVSKRTKHAEIGKWKGSILRSPMLDWDHAVVASYHPAYLFRNWEDRPITLLCLQRAAEEYQHWIKTGKIQPLPQRKLIADPSFNEARDFLQGLIADPRPISIDIENIGVYRGKFKTPQRNRLPYVVGFGNDPSIAVSVGLAEYEVGQTEIIWQLIDHILSKKRTVGQNSFTHDLPWLEYIGFASAPEMHEDTIIMHHCLWPELSHKLEFQTMQYTREPYYKDEGKAWTVKERQKLKTYNCKDICVTIENYYAMIHELEQRPKLMDFYRNYQLPLGRAFFYISKRGLMTDPHKLSELTTYLESELSQSCTRISGLLNGRSVVPKNPVKGKPLPDGTLNLASPPQVIELLKSLKIKVPIKRGRGTETSDEEALNEMFITTGNPVIKDILRIRELSKIRDTYVSTELEGGVLYSAYFVTGTVTGRRSSRENFLGLGTNGQNQPKHSDLGKRYRECLIARNGKIFVSCDQVQAEDWIVNAIIADQSGDRSGLEELINNVDRHAKLASFIFSKPLAVCGKGTPERFMGKKVRHAGNYDVGAMQLSAAFSKENFHVPPTTCDWLLRRFHMASPGIRGVFHKYVNDELTKTGCLTTPFFRERQFFGLRPYSDNHKIIKEAYAQIPQSTVGDNTGLAILWLEQHHFGYVVADGHDSVTLEVDDNLDSICKAVQWLQSAFDRVIRFPKGLTIKIPIEIELGYDLQNLSTCVNLTQIGLNTTYRTLKKPLKPQPATISGQALPSSQAHSNDTSGYKEASESSSPICTQS